MNDHVKVAVITTHPVQYNAPWFRLLAQQDGIKLKVFYTWSQSKEGAKYDPGFNQYIEWDIPLLEGYEYEFIENIAADPGSHHFKGIYNPSLKKDVEDFQPEAIIVIGWAYKSHFACMRYFKGKIPVVFRGDSTLLDETPGFKKWLRRSFLRYVYSFVDHALYVGTHNKNYFLAHGLNEEKLHFAPHAIDNDRFYGEFEDENKAIQWRKDLGISDDDFVVLFTGKFEEKKNPFFILQLAKRICSEKLRFVFVGNGPLERSLREKAAEDKRIIFIDFQNQQNMPVTYRLADVFILPSTGPGETWGLAINEAMACGRPVIASNKAGGAVDLIQSGKNGFIIDPNRPEETAILIEEMMEMKERSTEMGRVSKELVHSFSFQKIVDEVMNVVKNLKLNCTIA